MELKEMLESFGNLGGMAMLAGVMLWQNVNMFNKQAAIIEANTKSMSELTAVIHNFCESNKK